MKWGRDPFAGVQTLGTKDAAADQHHAEELIVQEQGLEPVFSPAISTRHAELLEQSDPTVLRTYERDLRSIQGELARRLPRWLLVSLLVLAFGIEAETGILFWKDEGLTGAPRGVMAAATAVTTIFLPWALIETLKHVLAFLYHHDATHEEAE